MKTSIALIGFMGSGKSVVGKILAGRLDKTFIEVDSKVELKAAKSIPQIFQEDGEIAFREIEIQVIKEIATSMNQVISCGGGAVLNRINIDRLKQDSVIVWLKVSPSVAARRTGLDGSSRPLLKNIHGKADISHLLKVRRPLYESAADFAVDTSDLSIDSVVSLILDRLKEDANYTRQK